MTLKPGYIFVGNPLHYQFKRAEHGGFSADDTHVALIVSSGGLSSHVQGTVVNDAVQTTQIAVTALRALGLNPNQLQGAKAEHTQQLPHLNLEAANKQKDDQQGSRQTPDDNSNPIGDQQTDKEKGLQQIDPFALNGASVPSGSPSSVMDQIFANLALLLSNAQNAYQSELFSMATLWESADALALQRLDALLSLEAGAMGISKGTLIRDLLFATMSSPNG